MLPIASIFIGVAMLTFLTLIGRDDSPAQPATATQIRPDPTPTAQLVTVAETATPRPLGTPVVAPTLLTPPPPTETPLPTATEKPAPEIGSPAPEFTLPDLKGNSVTLSELRGQRILLNFWATWCGPCKAEIPHLINAHLNNADQGFQVVTIAYQETAEQVDAFTKDAGYPFVMLVDEMGSVSYDYRIVGLPTSYFINEEGIIVSRFIGPMNAQILSQHMSKLMP
jgi:DsbE subfamily thiol:disulfide oxidoreductase